MLYLEENHENITKLISNTRFASAIIVKNMTFEFDSIF